MKGVLDMPEIRNRFRSNLAHGIKYTESRSREPEYINHFFPVIHRYIQKLKAQNPDLTLEELKQIMEEDIFEFSKAVFVGCNAPDAYIEYACSAYLAKNPNELNRILTQIKEEGLQAKDIAFYSQGNWSKDLLEYVLVLQANFPETLENLEQFLERTDLPDILHSTLSPQEKARTANEYIRKSIKAPYRKDCLTATNVYLYGIRAYVTEDRDIQEKHLRTNLVEYITAMTTQLKKFGFLEQYSRKHAKQVETLGISNLAYSETDLDKLLNLNFLSALPIDELLALAVFWLNRYTKEFDTYANAMFAIREFDLLPQMLASNNTSSVFVPEEQLKDMLVKMNTLYYPCVQCFEEHQAECNMCEMELTEEEDKGNYVLFSYEPLAERLQEDFGTEYTEYFSQGSYEAKHDLREDVLFYAKMQSPIYAAKTTKDEFLTSMLISLQNNPNLVNGGIVLEPELPEESVLQQRFIGLALDYNLSAPIRLHIRLDDVRDFLTSFQDHAKIQIYEGNEDFRLPKNQIMKNHLVLPFDRKMQKSLKDYARKELADMPPKLQRCVQHLNFLRDPKQVPPYLLTTVINEKGKPEQVFQKRYIDLQDGLTYTLEEGKYVLEETEQTMEGDELDYEHE